MSTLPTARLCAAALLGVALLALPASAAQVVEVRVGRHPTFTRVVFELDAPAGYRIERSGSAEGDAILVTLDASSSPRRIESRKSLVEMVEVEGGRSKALARIRLTERNLRVREMILADPPRIVLDVSRGTPQAASTPVKKPAPRPTATPTTRRSIPVTLPRGLLEDEPELPEEIASPGLPSAGGPSAPTIPSPVPTPSATDVGPKTEPRGPSPTAKPPTTPRPTTRAEAPPRPSAEPPAPAPPRAAVPSAPTTPPRSGTTATRPEPRTPSRTARTPTRPSPSERTPSTARPSSPSGTTAATGSESGGWTSWLPVEPGMAAALAGGVLVVVLATVFAMRRRSRLDERDVDVFGDEAHDVDDMSTPFGSSAYDEEPTAVDEEVGGAPLAGPAASAMYDDEDKGESDMEQMNVPVSGMDSPLPHGATAGDADLRRIVSELERRLTQAEARLDESVDACERLERQVAAQSEELRVQRAAIARTQRALRSLSRAEEDQATEPALREPR